MNTKAKHVVFLSETMPLGGTSTFALNVCAGLRKSGGWHGVAAGLREIGEVGPQIRNLGLTIFGPRPSSVLHEDRVEDIYRECARLSPRAVVAALSGGSFDFLRFVPEGCLRIGMIQSDEEGFYQLVDRYLPWLDVVAGVSREICRKMESRLGERRIPVIHQPYGVPMPMEKPVRNSGGPLRVLFLGRVVEEQKRISLLTRVMKATLKAGVNLTWTIAGDGPDLEFLKSEFADCDGKVRFLGSVPYREVPQILADHDVYFLCSDYEGLPLSLLEAMGAGLVPVVSDLPSGISEVVNDNNGIRVAIDDEVGYVNAVTSLAVDAPRRTALSARARAEVTHSHSTLSMARRWETMLDNHLPDTVPAWQDQFRATAPLDVRDRWCFHPTFRPLRSAGKRIKNWGSR